MRSMDKQSNKARFKLFFSSDQLSTGEDPGGLHWLHLQPPFSSFFLFCFPGVACTCHKNPSSTLITFFFQKKSCSGKRKYCLKLKITQLFLLADSVPSCSATVGVINLSIMY